jgi:hypothetical protein
MAEKSPQTRNELEDHLHEQLRLMTSSILSFDNRLEEEGKRIALGIRLLVHDTGKSTSLLGQLGHKKIQFYDTSDDLDQNSLELHLSHSGLITLNLHSGCYAPYLDSSINNEKLVTFDEWWDKIIFVDKEHNAITRRELVLCIADQDGGAHVDPYLDETYARLSRQNSLGWWVGDGKLSRPPTGKPALVAIRQIAHELFKSLEPITGLKPPLPMQRPGLFISNLRIQTAPIASTQRNAANRKHKVGRNDPCPCGSGKKYKKCHGK